MNTMETCCLHFQVIPEIAAIRAATAFVCLYGGSLVGGCVVCCVCGQQIAGWSCEANGLFHHE